jgi:hypothetical protein
LCKATDGFNLSFESLASRSALKLLLIVQANEPELWSELTKPRREVAASSNATDFTELPDNDTHDIDDDTSVPLDTIAAHVASPENPLPVGVASKEDGSLVAVNTSEQYEHPVEPEPAILPDADNSTAFEELGRGKRRKEANKLYDRFWAH